MARIPLITSREQVDQKDLPIVNEIAGEHGKITASWPILLHNPELARRVAHLGAFMRFDSDFSLTLRELITLSVAREFDCEYTWAAHAPQAVKAGVRPEAMRVIAYDEDASALLPEEGAIVSYVREMLRRHQVSDPTFAAAYELLGDAGIVELTNRIGYYVMLACGLNAFQIEGEQVIYLMTDQAGAAAGQQRWFCTSCMKDFFVATGSTVQACPSGHRADDAALSGGIPHLPPRQPALAERP